MKPTLEILEDRCCPALTVQQLMLPVTPQVANNFAALAQQAGIANPLVLQPTGLVGDVVLALTPQEQGLLVQAYQQLTAGPSPLTPLSIASLTDEAVNSLPGQPQLRITNRLQLDYGSYGRLLEGDAVPVPGTTSPPITDSNGNPMTADEAIAASEAALISAYDVYFAQHPNG